VAFPFCFTCVPDWHAFCLPRCGARGLRADVPILELTHTRVGAHRRKSVLQDPFRDPQAALSPLCFKRSLLLVEVALVFLRLLQSLPGRLSAVNLCQVQMAGHGSAGIREPVRHACRLRARLSRPGSERGIYPGQKIPGLAAIYYAIRSLGSSDCLRSVRRSASREGSRGCYLAFSRRKGTNGTRRSYSVRRADRLRSWPTNRADSESTMCPFRISDPSSRVRNLKTQLHDVRKAHGPLLAFDAS